MTDYLEKVVEAVEEALQQPVEVPKKECLRCGHKWEPHVAVPVCCPMCRSAYWNRPPQTERARRPSEAGLTKLRKYRKKSKRQNRKMHRLKELAKELGVELEGRLVTTETEATVVYGNSRAPETLAVVTRRTVPPPPGIEDL